MIIKIEVSSNALKAYIKVVEDHNADEQTPVSDDEIIEAVKGKQIIFGIDKEVITKLSGAKETTDELVIATGKPPTVGKNAEVHVLKRPKKREEVLPKANEDGDVDYISPRPGWIVPVNKDEEIVVKTPPTQGEPGKSIFGKEIPGIWGKDFDLDELGGLNTEIEENRLVATHDGFVITRANRLNVEPVYRIYDDIGPATGSIDIPQSYDVEIAISKDVKSGYSVKANKVTIAGCIEDSEVIANELEVTQGIVGTSEIPITAKRIKVGYINGSRKVYAEGINVTREVSAGAQVFADQVKASTIQGSTITASEYIWTNFLNGQNKIWVGIDYKAKMVHDRCSTELNNMEEPLEQLQKAWRNSEKRMNYLKELAKKNPKHPLIVKELPQIKEIKGKLDYYLEKKKKLEDDRSDALKKMYPSETPFLLVRNGFAKDSSAGSAVPPSTIIHVRQEVLKILEPSTGRLFAYEDGKLNTTARYNIKELKTKLKKIDW
ncbi:flagellar assembly protein A [candidate division KSB1 bacterium]